MSMTVEVAASLLGVEVSASKEEITSAFKSRSRLVHPDRVNGESEKAKATAEELMKQLNMAKEVLLAYEANPSSGSSGSASDGSNSNGGSNSGRQNFDTASSSKTGNGKVKKEQKPLTVEEQIEMFRAEREKDISEARSIVKETGLIYLANLGVLLAVMGVELFFVLSWVGVWDFWWMLASVAGLIATVYMWRRTLVRFFMFTYSVGELGAYKRLSRQEEKEYRKALKPDNPNSLLNKFKRFNDRF